MEPTSDRRTFSTAGKGSSGGLGNRGPWGLFALNAGSFPVISVEGPEDTGSIASSDEERSSEPLSMSILLYSKCNELGLLPKKVG